MYYMELALGQFAQRGPVSVWRLCPLGQGVGIAQCVVSCIGGFKIVIFSSISSCFLVAIYYNVIMAYCLFYIFSSFAAEVPWSKYSKEW